MALHFNYTPLFYMNGSTRPCPYHDAGLDNLCK